jgi:hypothetical protein
MSSRLRQALRAALPWLAVATLTAIVCQPLLGLPPRGHDTLMHFHRLTEVRSLLAHGVLFSRWSPDLCFGYGYPLFNFHFPLGVYLSLSTYWLTGGHAAAGWNLAFGMTLALAAVGMFLLGRELYDAPSALLATAAYVCAPVVLYHTFARGSLPNALAVGLAPLAGFGLVRAARRPERRRIAWAALALAALVLSHLAAGALLIAPLVVVAIATASCADAGREPIAARVRAVVWVVALGLVVAALAWLPALAELRQTQFQRASASVSMDFRRHFANLYDWPAAAIVGLANADLPITVGLGQLLLGSLGAGLAAVRLAAAPRKPATPSASDLITVVSGLLALAAVFLATPLAAPLWDALPFLQHLQFPWRWLDDGVLLLALACAGLGFHAVRRPALQAGLVAMSLLVFFANAVPYLYPPRWQSAPDHPTLADATRAQAQWGVCGLTSFDEFVPAAVRSAPTKVPFPSADLGVSLDRKLQRDDGAPDWLTARSGGPMQALLRVDLSTPRPLVFDTFYFPGWAATIDGRPALVGADDRGLLQVHVPAGAHAVEVFFGATPVRIVADAASLIGVGAVALLLLTPRTRARRRADRQSPLPHPTGSSSTSIVCIGVLVLLALAKWTWFDHFDSPFVRHVRDGAVAGTRSPPWRRFGGELELIGYSLDAANLTLYWRAERPPARDYAVQVLLTDARGNERSTVNGSPGHELTSRWEEGQLVRDTYRLPHQPAQTGNTHRIAVSVLDPNGGLPLPLLDSPDGAARTSPLGPVAE